ncbi:hypothetical protein BKA62DRAFT_640685 [Auriculariales sp. MPI-PUGE-AT-0066]|nr:hypothetical protein BKA62DRAFT_640685 [Auriculariales sp. MPI-PUGE-AT-0066]
MKFSLSFVVCAAAATLHASAAPNLEARQGQYGVYSKGTNGTVEGQASDFSATFHTSAFMTRGGCSTTASIKWCTAAELSADPTKNLETKDYKPYLTGGVGTNQRALLLAETYRNAANIVTHTVRFHISSTYTSAPLAGADKAVTFVALRNFDPKVGLKALDVKARTFTGEETSGTSLYVSIVHQDGSEDFPAQFSLKDSIGKTIEVTYKLGVDGKTIDGAGIFVASVTAKFVATGKQILSATVTKTAEAKGVISHNVPHRLIFGADRKASVGQKALKVWFGDYTVQPPAPFTPE